MKALVPVDGLPLLHTTPLGVVVIRDNRVEIEVDDRDERRIQLLFSPYQAVRVTTFDCFEPLGSDPFPLGTVVEVMESEWMTELRASLRKSDATASFMDKARHFIVPLQDDFAEVVAWEMKWEAV
jgi:hypothetical protein